MTKLEKRAIELVLEATDRCECYVCPKEKEDDLGNALFRLKEIGILQWDGRGYIISNSDPERVNNTIRSEIIADSLVRIADALEKISRK